MNTSTLQTAAQQFYEANGFEPVHCEPVEAEGRSFDVVIYRTELH